MGWNKPLETTQIVANGYKAIVSFGEIGKEKSDFAIELRRKNAIYSAYYKLVSNVIPKEAAIELMIKWAPGYKKKQVSLTKVSDSTRSMSKHPKSAFFEWALKHMI